MNLNNVRDIRWFHEHVLVSSYFLAEFLAETYDEWVPMRDELVQIFDRGQSDADNDKGKTV